MLWTAPPPAHGCAMDVVAVKAPTIRRSQNMQAITTIGLDIAKSVFQGTAASASSQRVAATSTRARRSFS
jgi:hypothetical protein